MPKPEAIPYDLLTCGVAAKILKCSADNVRRLTKAGHLAAAFTTAAPHWPIAPYRAADVEDLRAKRARRRRTLTPAERRCRKAVRP